MWRFFSRTTVKEADLIDRVQLGVKDCKLARRDRHAHRGCVTVSMASLQRRTLQRPRPRRMAQDEAAVGACPETDRRPARAVAARRDVWVLPGGPSLVDDHPPDGMVCTWMDDVRQAAAAVVGLIDKVDRLRLDAPQQGHRRGRAQPPLRSSGSTQDAADELAPRHRDDHRAKVERGRASPSGWARRPRASRTGSATTTSARTDGEEVTSDEPDLRADPGRRHQERVRRGRPRRREELDPVPPRVAVGARGLDVPSGRPATVTFTANSQTVASVPSDFHIASARSTTRTATTSRRPRTSASSSTVYNANASLGSGTPEAYTVWVGSILVGPKGDGSTGLLVYEKSKPTLSNDGDTTGLPDGYDLALVHGAKAEGFKLQRPRAGSGVRRGLHRRRERAAPQLPDRVRGGGRAVGRLPARPVEVTDGPAGAAAEGRPTQRLLRRPEPPRRPSELARTRSPTRGTSPSTSAAASAPGSATRSTTGTVFDAAALVQEQFYWSPLLGDDDHAGRREALQGHVNTCRQDVHDRSSSRSRS
jgi:hypothetical protein